MIWRRLRIVAQYFQFVYGMGKITWQAQPLYFFGLAALSIVQSFFPLATAWVTKLLFDALVLSLQGHGASSALLQHVLFLLAIQAGLLVGQQCISPLHQYFTTELSRQLNLKIKMDIYQKMNSFTGISYFEDPAFHNTVHLVSSNVLMMPQRVLSLFTSLFQSTITLMSFLGILIAFYPLLALLVAAAALPHLFIQMKFGNQHFRLAFTNSPRERRAAYYGQILSWLQFAKEVRLFNLGNYFLQAFVQITKQILQTQRNQQRREVYWQLPLALLESLVFTAAFVIVVMQALAGKLSIGDVSLYTSAVTSVQGTLLMLVVTFSQMNESALFYRRYKELLALPPSLASVVPPKAMSPLSAGITLQHVSFRYSDRHPWILRDVNLFLPAGECLALVGLNGTGKTTLVKLLTRLYDPTEGAILWDGIDIRAFEPGEYRKYIGAIFQDFVRYDLTVQHNIGVGNVALIEQSNAIQQAASKAGIHERILSLPKAYQTLLGRWLAEEGEGLDFSGGEWQKLALARLFMREADLLILDEPTAALDAQAEYELYTHFRDLIRGRTSLLISHRFSTVRMADRIAVLENGQITEYGSHTDLIHQGGTYAKLYNMQAEQYSDPSYAVSLGTDASIG